MPFGPGTYGAGGAVGRAMSFGGRPQQSAGYGSPLNRMPQRPPGMPQRPPGMQQRLQQGVGYGGPPQGIPPQMRPQMAQARSLRGMRRD